MRRAVILAAGQGSRLRPAWDRPKCLLPVGGRPLLQRYVQALTGAGFREIIVVTGYGHAQVQALVARLPAGDGRVRLVPHARYARGSVCSLEAARPWLTGRVLLMDGDVFFEEALLARFGGAAAEGLAIDPTASYSPEAYIGAVRGGRVVEMARGLRVSSGGECVGFAHLDGARAVRLAALARDRVARGDLDAAYEDLLCATVGERAMPAVSVAGLRWTEIDTPADLAAAHRLVAQGSARTRPARSSQQAPPRNSEARAAALGRTMRKDDHHE